MPEEQEPQEDQPQEQSDLDSIVAKHLNDLFDQKIKPMLDSIGGRVPNAEQLVAQVIDTLKSEVTAAAAPPTNGVHQPQTPHQQPTENAGATPDDDDLALEQSKQTALTALAEASKDNSKLTIGGIAKLLMAGAPLLDWGFGTWFKFKQMEVMLRDPFEYIGQIQQQNPLKAQMLGMMLYRDPVQAHVPNIMARAWIEGFTAKQKALGGVSGATAPDPLASPYVNPYAPGANGSGSNNGTTGGGPMNSTVWTPYGPESMPPDMNGMMPGGNSGSNVRGPVTFGKLAGE